MNDESQPDGGINGVENGPDRITNSKLNLATTVGGSETRKYLNTYVTPYLLNGMRMIAKEQPDEPLKILGQYLIEQNEITKKK